MNEFRSDQGIVNSSLPGTRIAVPKPAAKRRSIHPLLISVCIFVAVKLCPGLASTVWQTVTALPAEADQIAIVIDQAMTAGKARDAGAIYALFSAEAHESVPFSNIERLISGYNYVLFSGYRELSITEINMTWAGATTAEVSGSIAYDDGYTGVFAAELVKEDAGWRLQGFSITVPPAKVGAAR